MTSTTEAAGGITLRKLMSAARAITGKRPDTQKAMAILAPYRDLDIIPGVEKNTSDAQLHLVAATVADCYRIEGEFREAAAWYRRASRFRPDGGHVHFYAEMVIEQEIDDHYEEALRCLRHSMATWRHRSIIVPSGMLDLVFPPLDREARGFRGDSQAEPERRCHRNGPGEEARRQ
jgi:tetratricopeptide (TPR) repeat protein